MWAKMTGEVTCAESSRRLRSFHAGSMLWKTGGGFGDPVPADAEAVAVRRLGAELRVQALVDQRMRRAVEKLLHQDGATVYATQRHIARQP